MGHCGRLGARRAYLLRAVLPGVPGALGEGRHALQAELC